mgnify:CR=1 FL=1
MSDRPAAGRSTTVRPRPTFSRLGYAAVAIGPALPAEPTSCLPGGNDSFTLPVTQEELAGMVGASRERVNKAIASFIKLGWLEQQDRQYVILKRPSLEQRSK